MHILFFNYNIKNLVFFKILNMDKEDKEDKPA